MSSRNFLLTAIIISGLITIYGCKSQSDMNYKTENESVKPPPCGTMDKNADIKFSAITDNEVKQVDYKQQEQNYNTQDKRMIILSGTISIEADKFDDTEIKVKKITNNINGYITNTRK